jgi:eukaryotic-like serine/threonine-protein kinase
MTCPACGTDTSVALDRCESCGTAIRSFAQAGGPPGVSLAIAASPALPPSLDQTVAATLVPTQDFSGASTRSGNTRGYGPSTASQTGPLHIGQQFGPRYHVLKLLGIGGMAAVYQAWDEELGMAVALKVIRPDIVRDDAAAWQRRFKQELVLARQVTHKNVIRIHDLGEVDGIKYITMPFINGADLANVITRSGKLPIAEAMQYARQIAAGLKAAHEVGVVHRDLKPANILVGPDAVVITDFGIAHSLSGPGEFAGVIVGTIRYMAPEQAQGLPVDHRADLYAFGLILYEMLTGRMTTTGTNTIEVFNQKSAADGREEPFQIPDDVPPAVADVIRKCVQRNPDDRYASAAQLQEALDWTDDAGMPIPRPRVVTIPRFIPIFAGAQLARGTAVALVALCLAVPVASTVAFLGGSSRQTTPPAAHAPLSVLITDFDNRTGQAVFDRVVEQAVGVTLEGAPFINAYPRADALRLVKQIANVDRLDFNRARVLAQREGIDVLLGGAVVLDGSRYRITVNTIDPITGKTLDTFSRAVSDRNRVLEAAGAIASDVRTALGDTTPQSARLTAGETFTAATVDAASLYSQAQELLNNGKYGESVPLFRRATEMDPSFARAYASWAVSEYYLGHRDATEDLYKKAFALSGRISEREKYRTYGTYYLTVAQAYEEAIKNYERLAQLYPADRVAHGNLAVAYFYVLNFQKALEEGRRALALYPASPKLRNNVALYAMYAGDFAAAGREAGEVLKVDPKYERAYLPLAIGAIDTSPDAARAAYQTMAAINQSGGSRAAAGLADLSLYQSSPGDAEKILQLAITADEKAGNRPAAAFKLVTLAESFAQRGRAADAVGVTRRALALSRQDAVTVSAGRLFAQLGRDKDAAAIASELESRTQGYSRVYSRVIRAEIALHQHNVAEAVDTLRAGLQMADLWLLRFTLGRAYVEADRYPEALAEFEACAKRRGEATALFLDDVPTFRYLAPLPYWLARAQEGVGLQAQAVENYERFLSARASSPDVLARDARQRIVKLRS